jgi:hypothetical protein
MLKLIRIAAAFCLLMLSAIEAKSAPAQSLAEIFFGCCALVFAFYAFSLTTHAAWKGA